MLTGSRTFHAAQFQAFHQCCHLHSCQIDLINISIQKHIEVALVLCNIGQFFHIPAKKIIGPVGIHKQLFLHRTRRCIVMIQSHTRFTFMTSPVHVTGHNEIHITTRADIQDSDIMFSINIPIIAVSFLTEGKDLRHLAALYIVTPEFATLFKCEIVVAGVTGK